MKQTWKKANNSNPYMGIGNKICKNPKYWCRLYQVWLSEEDAINKKCFCKPTPDMMFERKCNCIEIKENNPFLFEKNKKKKKKKSK